MIKKFLLCIAAVGMLAGCSTVVNYSNLPNESLFTSGYEFMDKGNYTNAVQMFRNIILNADNPSNAQIAQKLMADAYFLNGDYADAIAAYEVYYELYRRSNDLAYVIYMLGVSYSNISLSGGRDTAYAQKALEYFEELEIRFPEAYTRFSAASHKTLMLKKLSDYEYRVARYYYRVNAYEPAMTRLVYLVNIYPGAPVEEEAYVLLVKTALKDDALKAYAPIYLDELRKHYPNNKKIASFEKKLK